MFSIFSLLFFLFFFGILAWDVVLLPWDAVLLRIWVLKKKTFFEDVLRIQLGCKGLWNSNLEFSTFSWLFWVSVSTLEVPRWFRILGVKCVRCRFFENLVESLWKLRKLSEKFQLGLDRLPDSLTGTISQSREEDGLLVYGSSRGAVTRVEYMVRQEGYIYIVKNL